MTLIFNEINLTLSNCKELNYDLFCNYKKGRKLTFLTLIVNLYIIRQAHLSQTAYAWSSFYISPNSRYNFMVAQMIVWVRHVNLKWDNQDELKNLQ